MAEEEEEDRGSCDGGEEGGTCPSSVCACHVFWTQSVAQSVCTPPSSRPPLSSVACSSTEQSSLRPAPPLNRAVSGLLGLS